VTGDEVYGANPSLRSLLEDRGVGYVLAVACDHRIPGSEPAKALAAWVPAVAWQRVSAGRGAKGHRLYDWAFLPLRAAGRRGSHWLLVRRNRRTRRAGVLPLLHAPPHPVPLAVLVRVAGRRWSIDPCQPWCTDKWEPAA
jgi:hypothetical protein